MKDKDILLKLRRKFTKDEVVNAIRLELKNTQFTLGVLKSEYAELEHKYTELKNINKDLMNSRGIISFDYTNQSPNIAELQVEQFKQIPK